MRRIKITALWSLTADLPTRHTIDATASPATSNGGQKQVCFTDPAATRFFCLTH